MFDKNIVLNKFWFFINLIEIMNNSKIFVFKLIVVNMYYFFDKLIILFIN